ncbi:pancreatic triacylglycerol lipase-like [Antedon mediterranea]|uniref:pancreatic triacylglycerol lipase-like n=1 Tax=Antedon mediterranea TaxID=105859 RepID=UPI003AF49DE1
MANTFGLVCCFLLLLSKLNDVEGFKTKFILHTRQNYKNESLSANDKASIFNSKFDPAKQTKFIIHGFMESSEEEYVSLMSLSLLGEGDYNVVTVDWGNGGEGNALDYSSAVGKVVLVGESIIDLIKTLKTEREMSLSDVHLIGFALGAHCAGYVGKEFRQEKKKGNLPSIGRITGLDPDEYNYAGDEEVPLSAIIGRTDAKLVDIIHTETTILGREISVGHLDFYVNHQEGQISCPQITVKTVLDVEGYEVEDNLFSCDHKRAAYYFIASIVAERYFTVCRCYGCSACGSDGCPRMGLHADEYERNNQNKVFYVRAADKKITIDVTTAPKPNGESYDRRGRLSIEWTGTNTYVPVEPLGKTSTKHFKSSTTYPFSRLLPEDPGKLQKVKLSWRYDSHWYKPWKWGLLKSKYIFIDRVEITIFPTGTSLTTRAKSEEWLLKWFVRHN